MVVVVTDPILYVLIAIGFIDLSLWVYLTMHVAFLGDWWRRRQEKKAGYVRHGDYLYWHQFNYGIETGKMPIMNLSKLYEDATGIVPRDDVASLVRRALKEKLKNEASSVIDGMVADQEVSGALKEKVRKIIESELKF